MNEKNQKYLPSLGARSLADGTSAGVEGGFLIVLSSVLAVDSFVSKTPLPAHRYFKPLA